MSEEYLNPEEPQEEQPEESQEEEVKDQIIYLSGMYRNWFLDYASYVILERAVPYINEWFKTGSATYYACHARDGRWQV